jgi:DNA-binding IclR family transcriptional regulator
VTGIAAPLFDSQNDVTGSLSLTFPGTKMLASDISKVGKQLVVAAVSISEQIRQKS